MSIYDPTLESTKIIASGIRKLLSPEYHVECYARYFIYITYNDQISGGQTGRYAHNPCKHVKIYNRDNEFSCIAGIGFFGNILLSVTHSKIFVDISDPQSINTIIKYAKKVFDDNN